MKAIFKFFQNQWEKSSLLGKAAMVCFAVLFLSLLSPAAVVVCPIPFLIKDK
ncbi:hypothetical protein [Candidatus Proelusimicrobium excrementi]|uniref:hypothetical protein n=1 Tax=Candidatus Proelusimicrobium excrementi TaxID=3416222 RepID=UPI003D141267